MSSVSALLVAQVAFGAAVLAGAGWALASARRSPGRRARWATGFTMAALTGTAGTGAVFLATGIAPGLVVDRGLALLSLLGATLMVVYGKPPAQDPPPGPGSCPPTLRETVPEGGADRP